MTCSAAFSRPGRLSLFALLSSFTTHTHTHTYTSIKFIRRLYAFYWVHVDKYISIGNFIRKHSSFPFVAGRKLLFLPPHYNVSISWRAIVFDFVAIRSFFFMKKDERTKFSSKCFARKCLLDSFCWIHSMQELLLVWNFPYIVYMRCCGVDVPTASSMWQTSQLFSLSVFLSP